MKSIILEEVSEQVELTTILDDDASVRDEIDPVELGSTTGRQIGEELGRTIGEAVGEAVHETLSSGLEHGKSLEEISTELVNAVREAITEAFENGDESALSNAVGSIRERDIGDDVLPDDAAGVLESEKESESEGDQPPDDDEKSETEGDQPPDENGNGDGSIALEGLRQETLEDMLDVLSYHELQSVAKDVGVKANLSRDEMKARIVETT